MHADSPTRARLAPGVAAGHPATAATGIDVLEAGGNAVDVAVAMMLTSCVAETVYTGLGGGGFATVYDAASGEVACVDFFVAIPGLSGRPPGPTVPVTIRFGGQLLPYAIGAASAAVPGVPRGAAHLHERWGSLSWDAVCRPAIEAARHGVVLTREHKLTLDSIWPCMGMGFGDRVHRRPDGAIVTAGDTLRIPNLWKALERLRVDGPDAFYSGDVAHAMLHAFGRDGAIDPEDLAAYRVLDTVPRVSEVRGGRVHARGDDLDDLLGTLERLEASGSAGEAWSTPRAATALVGALRAGALRTETTNLVACDTDGNVCVITTSLGLGAGVWVPEYGLHPNSMLGEGELIRPGALPGSRMGSMMSPLIITDDDGPVLAAGAAGGSRIRSSLAQVLLGVLAGGRPVQEAISAPRLNPVDDLVRIEPGFAHEVIAELRAAGERLVVSEMRHPYFGGVSAISRTGAGADPRRGGVAVTLT
ncbi:gamma-glutamyltransferase [Cumulibacter manganitolerans]|uniref:gamma-glutamyltransferase n=1 Tax=Cumulibacter manganitolerans TaxID=1884992 RepID=UPI001297F875|nr:gamma-glutamyltransferase [Cumulibacter manganitolerans]